MKYAPLLELLLSGDNAVARLTPPLGVTVQQAAARVRSGLRTVINKTGLGSTVVVQVAIQDDQLLVSLARKSEFEDEYAVAGSTPEEEE